VSHEAEIDDILNLIDILDLQSEFNRFKFVACNLDNFPKFGPKEINIAAVINRQAIVEASVQDISSRVHDLVTNQERLLLTSRTWPLLSSRWQTVLLMILKSHLLLV